MVKRGMSGFLHLCGYPDGEAGAFVVLGFGADVATKGLGEFFGYGEAYAYTGGEGGVAPEDIKDVTDKLFLDAVAGVFYVDLYDSLTQEIFPPEEDGLASIGAIRETDRIGVVLG